MLIVPFLFTRKGNMATKKEKEEAIDQLSQMLTHREERSAHLQRELFKLQGAYALNQECVDDLRSRIKGLKE